jgi:hypothetical protein
MLGVGEGTPTVALALIGIGVAIFLFRRFQFEVFSFIVISLMLSQSAYLGSPFYPFRFNPYFLQAVALLFAVSVHGIMQILKKFPISLQPLFVGALLTFVAVSQVLHVRALGLWITNQKSNPASVILDDDVAMYRWIARNTPQASVIAAPFKWGYYIPAIAERSVVMDTAVGGDIRDARYQLAGEVGMLFWTTSAADAATRAKAIGVQYVYWDASFTRYGTGYSQAKFNDAAYFREVHRMNGASLYEVL